MNTSCKPTDVLMIPFNGCHPSDATKSVRQLRSDRRAIHPSRELFVARLATALAKNTHKALKQLGFKEKRDRSQICSRSKVVVLSETADQAWRFQALLPCWDVCDAVPVESECAGWDSEPDIAPSVPHGRISTLVYLARNRLECDILIRATAGTGSLRWDWFITPPKLIVDLMDQKQCGERAFIDAEQRRSEYRKQGLKERRVTGEPGIPP